MTRVAFLVIHGIGNQNPYETLDSFTQGLTGNLAARGGGNISWEHHQVARDDGDESWMQHYLHAAPDGGFSDGVDGAGNVASIDVFEHYWAHRMSDQADMSDILSFLQNASRNAREFYAAQTDAAERMRKSKGATRLVDQGQQVTFNDNGYIKLLAKSWPFAVWTWRVIKLFSWFPSLQALLEKIIRQFEDQILSVVGDVAVYVQMDKKQRDNAVRQSIIAEASTAISALAQDDRYDRVIVAGHSLGSVIAYDALGRLNKSGRLLQGEASKIRLVTFGSPLDKIYFFFRKHDESLGLNRQGADRPILRSQIIRHQHSLRRKDDASLDDLAQQLPLVDRTSSALADLPWINVYNQYDPVSGHLDAYDAGNIDLDIDETNAVSAHLAYWQDKRFYQAVLDHFVFGTKRLGPNNQV